MDVSILIISYNTGDLTLACLRSVYEQTSGVEFEVIVYDNASADGSADAIAAEFPQARVIAATTNVGFARGNNLAALNARGTYLLLLNPDTEILDGAVQKVVAFAKTQAGEKIIGGRTFFADGSLNYNSCHGRPTPWSLLCMGTGISSVFRRSRLFNPEALGAWKRDSVREVDAITGCFLLISQNLWNRLDGFEESYFMYGEDTDLCLRARSLGAVSIIFPEATLVHHGGKSEKLRADKMVRLFRAKGQLFEKHWQPWLVPLGGLMLQAWAASRTIAIRLVMILKNDRRAAYDAWREVFKRRGEYVPRRRCLEDGWRSVVREPSERTG